MKRKLLLTVAIIEILALQSCKIVQRPITETPPVNNKTYKVSYLFEYDGCKVYRFYDDGHYVYFTNCKGDVTSIKADSTQERVVNKVRVTP